MALSLQDAIQDILAISNPALARSHGEQPRQLICGCCLGGCICVMHASPEVGIPPTTCIGHSISALPSTTPTNRNTPIDLESLPQSSPEARQEVGEIMALLDDVLSFPPKGGQ